jgi:hypothetical protein
MMLRQDSLSENAALKTRRQPGMVIGVRVAGRRSVASRLGRYISDPHATTFMPSLSQ